MEQHIGQSAEKNRRCQRKKETIEYFLFLMDRHPNKLPKEKRSPKKSQHQEYSKSVDFDYFKLQ